MLIRNVHERVVEAPIELLGPLLDRLGGPADVLWPAPEWEPMELDGPVAVGASGGHGPIRYTVTAYEPGRLVEFTFAPGMGLAGRHTFTAEPAGAGRTRLRHVAEGRVTGVMRLAWPLVVRALHDAVLEDLLDRAATAVGRPPAARATWSPWVRLVRLFDGPATREAPVTASPLLAAALPRVDWSDAHAVDRWAGMPEDPQVWADATFRTPPPWVAALMGVRQALVGLVGIDRGDPSSFDTVATSPGEVLLGTDERHLDFRAAVRVEERQVVLTTVVQLHNARGRAYFALVKLLHPAIVRAMLGRAARLLSRSSNAATRPPTTIGT